MPEPTPPDSSPSGAGDPDNPRDLVGPPVVLSGTVRREPGCVILETGGRRWALTGPAAAGLADGERVTVRGRPVAAPAGCDAPFGLAVRTSAGN